MRQGVNLFLRLSSDVLLLFFIKPQRRRRKTLRFVWQYT